MSGALAALGWKASALAVSGVFGTTFVQSRYAAGAFLQVNAALPGYITPNAYQKTPMPLDPSKPRVHAVFDPAALLPGDIIVGPLAVGGVTETFFIATIQPPAPPLAIRCNAVVNVSRSVRPSWFGAQAPLDSQIGTEDTILEGWPASMLPTGRSATGAVQLPDDVNLGAFTVLLPTNLPILLRSGDAITNITAPENIRVIVAGADHTPDQWRMLCQESAA